MSLYHLLLLLLFSFQLVAALPLPSLGRDDHSSDHSDTQPGHQLDHRPNEPPAQRLGHTHSPTEPTQVLPELSPPLSTQVPTSQIATFQPSTVTNVQFITSPTGVVKQTCLIILSPISGGELQEVKKCTLSTVPDVSSSVTAESGSSSTVPLAAPSPTVPVVTSSPSITTSSAPSSSLSIVPTSLAPAPAPASLSSISISSSSISSSSSSVSSSSLSISSSSSSISSSSSSISSSSSSISSSSSSIATSSMSVPASSPSISISLLSVPTSLSVPSSIPTSLSSTSSVPTSVVSSVRVKGASSVPASAAATSASSISGTVVAADATDTTVPGRTLSVLPIGLGVFAGVSVIALVVVGLVTYERTKYRKAFRQRRLAELGAEMGRGGIAL